jgi:hypothetical protein
MSHPSSPPERLERALADPSRGALGLVDELLDVSRHQDIRLDWQAGRCRVSFPGGGPPDQIEASLPRSVFRAVIARVAVLCNERVPNSVSPYGGQGEVAIGSDPPTAIRAVFVNTPQTQSLDLASVRPGADDRGQGRPLAAVVGPARLARD